MIVSTRYVVEGTPETRRTIMFYCLDHLGNEHPFGPVYSTDPNYDPSVTAPLVGAKVESKLADAEFAALMEGN